MDVVDDEQEWSQSTRMREEFDDRRVETVALRLGIPSGRRRQWADEKRKGGQQADQLAGVGAETVLQGSWVGNAHQEFEGLDERLVGRIDDCVRTSEEDKRAALGRTAGKLANESSLAAARLAADQRHLAAVPFLRESQ